MRAKQPATHTQWNVPTVTLAARQHDACVCVFVTRKENKRNKMYKPFFLTRTHTHPVLYCSPLKFLI